MGRQYKVGPLTPEYDQAVLLEELEKLETTLEDLSTDGVWEDYTADLTAARPGATSPPGFATFRNGLMSFAFSGTSMEEVFINFHIKHDIKLGTGLYPHVHWSPGNSTGTGVVRWGFEYSVAKGHSQQAFPASTIVYVEQAGAGIAYYHQVAEVSDTDVIPATNIEPDSVIMMRIFRDATHANDTFVGDAYAFQADIHYQRERLGTLNKAPNFYRG